MGYRTKYSSRAVFGIGAIWDVCKDDRRTSKRGMVGFEDRAGLALHLHNRTFVISTAVAVLGRDSRIKVYRGVFTSHVN
jgi:hypothetical protein